MYSMAGDSVITEVIDPASGEVRVLHIPQDPGNVDFQAYQEWLKKGNQLSVTEPAITNPPIPDPLRSLEAKFEDMATSLKTLSETVSANAAAITDISVSLNPAPIPEPIPEPPVTQPAS